MAAALRQLPQQLRQLVDDHDRRCEQLAHLFADTQDVIFLGRGINYPIALLYVLLPVPVLVQFLRTFLTVNLMQLLSYHVAAHRGLDVDQPRNLAKSVTVE